jgi:carboxyl-terminal processing protease
MILPEVATRIKGEPGTSVQMTVYRPSETEYLEFDVIRREVQFSSVSDIELLDGRIGYLKINNFAEQTGPDFRAAVEDLLEQGMEALVIDLRNNSGGLFQAAIEVANCFVKDEDVIVRIYDRDAETSQNKDDGFAVEADPDAKKYDIPLVALINENSASSSEILVGALQDHGLAKVVGEKSFGKGVIQAVNPMDYRTEKYVGDNGEEYEQQVVRSALALTIGKYFTPDRHDIHRRGIEPNIWHSIDNRLATEPELIALEEKINEKTEELRLLRAQLYKYLRDNDVVKDHGLEVAEKLASGMDVADVPQLELTEEEHHPLTAADDSGEADADINEASLSQEEKSGDE